MDNSKFVIKNDKIYKNGHIILRCEEEILNFVLVDCEIVVLLKCNPKMSNRNVFCYDIKGSLKWQIPAPIELHDENDFTGIYFRGGDLYAYNRNGVEYHLDVETGKIIGSDLIK